MIEELRRKVLAILAKLTTDARCIEAGIRKDDEPELIGEAEKQISVAYKSAGYVKVETRRINMDEQGESLTVYREMKQTKVFNSGFDYDFLGRCQSQKEDGNECCEPAFYRVWWHLGDGSISEEMLLCGKHFQMIRKEEREYEQNSNRAGKKP